MGAVILDREESYRIIGACFEVSKIEHESYINQSSRVSREDF
jgi:hypothetical protein